MVRAIDCGTGGEIYPRKAWVLSLWPSSSVYLKCMTGSFYNVFLIPKHKIIKHKAYKKRKTREIVLSEL